MPRNETRWARSADDHVYHEVTFGWGPNIQELTATCGKTTRFWPKIGVRMDDVHCRECSQSVAAREGAM